MKNFLMEEFDLKKLYAQMYEQHEAVEEAPVPPPPKMDAPQTQSQVYAEGEQPGHHHHNQLIYS
jgi:hypothetical protein